LDESRSFIGKLATRKGVRIRALSYLVRRINEPIQLQEIADHLKCHTRSVKLALEPLLSNPFWEGLLKKRKIGSAVIYELKEGKASNLLKNWLEYLDKELKDLNYY